MMFRVGPYYADPRTKPVVKRHPTHSTFKIETVSERAGRHGDRTYVGYFSIQRCILCVVHRPLAIEMERKDKLHKHPTLEIGEIQLTILPEYAVAVHDQPEVSVVAGCSESVAG